MPKLTQLQLSYVDAVFNNQEFKNSLYEGLTWEKQIKFQQIYFTTKACIILLEKSKLTDFANAVILDPCCGSGQILVAALCAGASTDKIFGNDIDIDAVVLCRKRINMAIDILNSINAYGINNRKYIEDWQIHQGNALVPECLDTFGPEYDELILKKYLKDLQ